MMNLAAQAWEIDAALLLSEIVYNDKSKADLSRFTGRYAVHGEVCFFRTECKQKYVIATVTKDDHRVLFCAFAGTHLDGDWEKVNLRAWQETDSQEIGASAHAGFVNRARAIPLELVERLAHHAKASRIVFCGHSLGGAVAHLCLARHLFAQREGDYGEGDYGKDNVLSIGIGAPFIGGQDLLDHMKRHGWLERIIVLVNEGDPVPHALSLVSGLIESDVFASLAPKLANWVSGAVTNREHAQGLLASAIASALRRGFLGQMESYCPIGHYLCFGREAGFRVALDDDTLTPQDLLTDLTAEGNGIALARHAIRAYQSLFRANERDIRNVCISNEQVLFHDNFGYDLAEGLESDTLLRTTNLMPQVHEVVCETFENESVGPPHRLIHIYGLNLDGAAVTIDAHEEDLRWSKNCVVMSGIIRRSGGHLIFGQQFKEDASIKPQPLRDLSVRIQSDVVASNGRRAFAVTELKRKQCHSASGNHVDPHLFYGGQFFLDTQQHAWIMEKKFGDQRLKRTLQELQDKVNEKLPSLGAEFLLTREDWNRLEDVGSGVNQGKKSRDQLYDWIVPPNGIVVRTKTQEMAGYAVGATAIMVGVGIIWMGGLGVVGAYLGYGTGVSATGGWGWATLSWTGGFTGAYFGFRSRMPSKYFFMLQDMLKKLKRPIPRTQSEFAMEEELLQAYDKQRQGGRAFGDYTGASQKELEVRLAIIGILHAMKKERKRTTIIAICGPQNSGKTTLMSQLLRQPELALDTGIEGGQAETRTTTPYAIKQVADVILLDTPGSTGPEELVRNQFDRFALNLAEVFVFVREYQGQPSAKDLKTLTKVIGSEARSKDPKILICLNRSKTKLTEDALGEIWHLTAHGQQNRWKERLIELQAQSFGSRHVPSFIQRWFESNVTVACVELHGDRNLEEDFKKDSRLAGMWTAHSIGNWIAEQTKPTENPSQNWFQFSDFMKSFDYKKWRTEAARLRTQQNHKTDLTTYAVLSG